MCTRNRLSEILGVIAAESKRAFGSSLDSVVLFGSYARGDYDEESDIDVLILVDLPAEELSKYRAQLDSLCGELLIKYGIVVSAIEKDLTSYNKYANVLPFYKSIKREGVKIA